MKPYWLLLVGIFALPTIAYAGCDSSSSMADLTSCQHTEYLKDQKKLDAAYQDTMNSIKSGTDYWKGQESEIIESLEESQKLWVQFRDKYCHAVKVNWEQGSIGSIRYWGCMAQLTEERIKQLRSFGD